MFQRESPHILKTQGMKKASMVADGWMDGGSVNLEKQKFVTQNSSAFYQTYIPENYLN